MRSHSTLQPQMQRENPFIQMGQHQYAGYYSPYHDHADHLEEVGGHSSPVDAEVYPG